MADVAQPSTSLTFVNDDVRAQIKVSRDILAVAEKLREAVGHERDETAKMIVQKAIQDLLMIANTLTVNASTTTSSASSTVATLCLDRSKRAP